MQGLKKGSAFPLGVSKTVNGLQFAVYAPRAEQISLQILDKVSVKQNIDLKPYRIGNVYSVCIPKQKAKGLEGYTYGYRIDGKWMTDPYATRVKGTEVWGALNEENPKAGVLWEDKFSWEEDVHLGIPFTELNLYQLHVRGFTKDASSAVKHRGTFRGIVEKIPYLCNLGINGLLLLPCYDFCECMKYKAGNMYEPIGKHKLNYWGYGKEAFYFTPKASFASDVENPQNEMKEMVLKLHANGIEVLMDLYFPKGYPAHRITDVMRFWITEYHIDGFRINDDVVSTEYIANDPIIGSVKLLASDWNMHNPLQLRNENEESSLNRTNEKDERLKAIFNDGFRNDARRFLRGEEGKVGAFMERFRCNPKYVGVINYMTSVNGFTMMDLVSYDMKHNIENEEQNRDGEEINYSWNCGKEGPSRKNQINTLRRQQIMNAWLMLFFSQGTPMLLAGDEFLQTQNGNNNPYCQDNKTTWLNWELLEKNQDMFTFIQSLIRFRKKYQRLLVLQQTKDYGGNQKECPELSFHSKKAWYIDTSNYSRFFAVLFNDLGGESGTKKESKSIYIAFNMHNTAEDFELPRPMPGQLWKLWCDTSISKTPEAKLENQRKYRLMPHAAVVLYGVEKV